MMNMQELKELNMKLVKLKGKDIYKFYEVKGIVEWLSLTNKDFK